MMLPNRYLQAVQPLAPFAAEARQILICGRGVDILDEVTSPGNMGLPEMWYRFNFPVNC
jgi:hypothetical protein